MDRLTDEELAAELRRVTLLNAIADTAGEVDASTVYAAMARAIEFEQRQRAGG